MGEVERAPLERLQPDVSPPHELQNPSVARTKGGLATGLVLIEKNFHALLHTRLARIEDLSRLHLVKSPQEFSESPPLPMKVDSFSTAGRPRFLDRLNSQNLEPSPQYLRTHSLPR